MTLAPQEAPVSEANLAESISRPKAQQLSLAAAVPPRHRENTVANYECQFASNRDPFFASNRDPC